MSPCGLSLLLKIVFVRFILLYVALIVHFYCHIVFSCINILELISLQYC